MTHLVTSEIDSLQRIHNFAVKYAADFPDGSLGAQKFAEVDAALDALKGLGADQISGMNAATGGTGLKATAYAALHADLVAINENAHTLVTLGTPGLGTKFRLPRSGGKQALLNAARACAQDALPLKDQFISLHMPADFLDTLNAHIAAYEAATTKKQTGTGKQIKATTAIDGTVHTALVAARVLKTVVGNTYRTNAAVLAEWLADSHVTHAPQSATPAPPAPTPTATPGK